MRRWTVAFVAVAVLALLVGWATLGSLRNAPPFAFLEGIRPMSAPEFVDSHDRGFVRIRSYSIHASFNSLAKRAAPELAKAGWYNAGSICDTDTLMDCRSGKDLTWHTGVFEGPSHSRPWAVLLVYDGVKEGSVIGPDTSLPDWVDNNSRFGVPGRRRALTVEPGWCTLTLIESNPPSSWE